MLFALLSCSVAIKATWGSDGGENAPIEDAVVDFMTSRGFSFKGVVDADGELLKPMVFASPSCGPTLKVTPTSRNFQAKALLDHVGGAGDQRYFAYLGLITQWDGSRDMFFEHVKQRALEFLGLSPYDLDSAMVMINEPAGCDIVARIDWSTLWKKDFRARVAKEKLATSQGEARATR
jgi:hypothetical protein